MFIYSCILTNEFLYLFIEDHLIADISNNIEYVNF